MNINESCFFMLFNVEDKLILTIIWIQFFTQVYILLTKHYSRTYLEQRFLRASIYFKMSTFYLGEINIPKREIAHKSCRILIECK